MKQLYFGLIAGALTTLGCAAPHHPTDPFRGPELTADSSSVPRGGAPEMPVGPSSTSESAPNAYPDAGLYGTNPVHSVEPPDPSAHAPDALVQVPDPSHHAPVFAPPAGPPQQPLGWKNTVETESVPGKGQNIAPISYEEEGPAGKTVPAPIDGNEQFRGRDAQFGWISGTLQYVSMDRKWQVRYAPYSVEDDRFGGSLLLEDDPRLADFESGDVVYVEGELVNQPTRMVRDNAVYRIKSIRPL